MKNTLFAFVLLFVLLTSGIFAQQKDFKKHLDLNIFQMTFIKDNEYFNHIADGYTLPGSNLTPCLSFAPYPGFKIKGGVFLHRYWGTDTLQYTIPVFSLEYKHNNSTWILGNLRHGGFHHLIPPLMGVENRLDYRRLETGVQYLYTDTKLRADVWGNWKRFILKKSNFPEEISSGLSLRYRIFRKNKWSMQLYWQSLVYHRGGQINVMPEGQRHTFTLLHGAPGAKLSYAVHPKIKLWIYSYFIKSTANNDTRELIFKNGYAWFSRLGMTYRHFRISAGHWYGYHFSSPYGDDIYQGVSRITDTEYINGELSQEHAGYTEPVRSLLSVRATYRKDIFKNLNIKLFSEMYYQNFYSNPTPWIPENTVKNHADFTLGLSVIYKGKVRLWTENPDKKP